MAASLIPPSHDVRSSIGRGVPIAMTDYFFLALRTGFSPAPRWCELMLSVRTDKTDYFMLISMLMIPKKFEFDSLTSNNVPFINGYQDDIEHE